MTHHSLEDDLRLALTRTAAHVEPEPAAWEHFQERMRAEDVPTSSASWGAHATPSSLPTRRRLHRPLLAAAAAAAIVAGGIAAGSAWMPNTAYASWHSTPDRLTASEKRAAQYACTVSTPLVMDRRGNNVYVLSRSATTIDSCVTTLPGLDDDGLSQTYRSTRPASTSGTNRAATLSVLDVKAPEGNHTAGAPKPLEYVAGRVSSQVHKVVVRTSQGEVEATIAGEWFAAWWPGNDAATASVRAYDASGQEIAGASDLTNVDGPRVSQGTSGSATSSP